MKGPTASLATGRFPDASESRCQVQSNRRSSCHLQAAPATREAPAAPVPERCRRSSSHQAPPLELPRTLSHFTTPEACPRPRAPHLRTHATLHLFLALKPPTDEACRHQPSLPPPPRSRSLWSARRGTAETGVAARAGAPGEPLGRGGGARPVCEGCEGPRPWRSGGVLILWSRGCALSSAAFSCCLGWSYPEVPVFSGIARIDLRIT